MPTADFDVSERALAELAKLEAHVDKLECSIGELENHIDKKLWELERDLKEIKNALHIGTR